MEHYIAVGLDVGSTELVGVIATPDGTHHPVRVPNTPAGHTTLLQRLTASPHPVRVGLEATGVYHLEVAMRLHAHPDITLCVANPRTARDFARAHSPRAKTDTTDAQALLAFVQHMPFTPWTPPAPALQALQALARRIDALTAMQTQEKNRRHALDRLPARCPALTRDSTRHLAYLARSITRLRQAAVDLITAHPTLHARFRQLCSIPGIATASAIPLLAELAPLPPAMTVRQWVAHAGLDPRPHTSGTSVHKRPRISKVGNAHIRRALYMPALVAAHRDPHLHAFYQRLLARGKAKRQALTAVMRKLLHAIYGLYKHQAYYNGARLCPQTP